MLTWRLRSGLCVRIAKFSYTRRLSTSTRLVLGIESSCDDSCAAVVSSKGSILSSFQLSQEKQNQQNRGVIPSEAAKTHRKNLPIVVEKALGSIYGENRCCRLDHWPRDCSLFGRGSFICSIILSEKEITIGPCKSYGRTCYGSYNESVQIKMLIISRMTCHFHRLHS